LFRILVPAILPIWASPLRTAWDSLRQPLTASTRWPPSDRPPHNSASPLEKFPTPLCVCCWREPVDI
jgi:hypothetical protein